MNPARTSDDLYLLFLKLLSCRNLCGAADSLFYYFRGEIKVLIVKEFSYTLSEDNTRFKVF